MIASSPRSGSHNLDTGLDDVAEAVLPNASEAAGFIEPVPLLQSAELLQGHKRVQIAHNGARYQLQITRQGKLILTK